MDKIDETETHDTIPSPPVIEAGHAREAVLVALANAAKVLMELEGVAFAIARALDATAEAKTGGAA